MSNNIKEAIEPTTEAFMKLGFYKYESQVLAILSAIGTSTVKEIHKYTDVPLPKVYQTLDSLVGKNLIKLHSKTRPAEYTAYSADIIIRKIQNENRSSEEKLRNELTNLSELAKPSFEGDISPFTGLDSFKKIGSGIINNCSNQISVAMSSVTLTHLKQELLDAKTRGVSLRSMTFSKLTTLRSDLKDNTYKELGFDHYLADMPMALKPSLKWFSIIKSLINVYDYLGILISDAGESVVLLPLFPFETVFGIWISSPQIIKQQLEAYNAIFKITTKA